MNQIEPIISVILPVYNGQDHLKECIESILNQSYQNFEFIITDDASTDNTPEILRKYSQIDNRIKIISHESNQKQTTAANSAIKMAHGTLLARMDADDIALPNRLEEQEKFMTNNPSIGLIGSWVDIIDEEGNIIKVWKTLPSNGILKWNLHFGTSFAHSSVMMRKDIVEQVGLYQSPEAEDYDLWSRISKVSEVANLPIVLQQKRVWFGQLALKVPQETRDCVIEIMRKNINHSLSTEDLSINFIRQIRAVSDKNPILENGRSIAQVRNVLLRLYRNIKLNVKLSKVELKYISKDLYRKLYTLSDWQSSANSFRGILEKIYLAVRFPNYSLYRIFKFKKKF